MASKQVKKMSPLFSSGPELGNLIVSSGVLRLSSTAANSDLYGGGLLNQDELVRWKVYLEPPDCNILAFVTSPTLTINQYLHDHKLVPSSSLPRPLFDFLFTKDNSSFFIHESAVTLFASIHGQLLPTLRDQLENPTPLIVTGHALGGSVASLVTLWLLKNITRPSKKRTLCVTFGSPLLGDKGLQQAISHHSTWNSCFLHVAANLDLVPRLFISSTHTTVPYKPFGTFLLCSESGCACPEDPETVFEVLVTWAAGNQSPNEEWPMSFYGRIVERLESIVLLKGISQISELTAVDPLLQAGIVLQLEGIGVKRTQQNSDGMNALIAKMVKWEKICMLNKKKGFDPNRKLNDIKIYMAYVEWYKKYSKTEGIGYYNSYKKGSLPKDVDIVKYNKHLKNYWVKMVEEVDTMPQTEESAFRVRWLYGGTNYRRMMEPLDIADYYAKGFTNYKTEGRRSKHYIKLEQWLEEDARKNTSSTTSLESKKKNVSASLTEDSCFWAHVEEALIRRSVKNGTEEELKRQDLEFEEYVMKQIKNYAVSPEIFLEGSGFMQWWKEYKEAIGTSYNSELAVFMKNDKYRQYGSGSFLGSFSSFFHK